MRHQNIGISAGKVELRGALGALPTAVRRQGRAVHDVVCRTL